MRPSGRRRSKRWRAENRAPRFPSATSPGPRPTARRFRLSRAAGTGGHSAGGDHHPDRHRPAPARHDAEIREICGAEIAAAYRVVNHDARNLSSHRHLGTTASGTPVYVDERFIAADLHITLGFIEPHLMLGLFGRPETGRSGPGGAGDHQGAAQPEVHARCRAPSKARSRTIRCTANCSRSRAWPGTISCWTWR